MLAKIQPPDPNNDGVERRADSGDIPAILPLARRLFMCRNIKILFNFEPPVTDDEVRAAALQFVRKISGFNKPSQANQASFLAAVEDITMVSRRLLYSLETSAPPKNREEEAAKAKARSLQRFRT